MASSEKITTVGAKVRRELMERSDRTAERPIGTKSGQVTAERGSAGSHCTGFKSTEPGIQKLVLIKMTGEPLAKLLGCGSAQSSDSQGEHPIVLDFDCVFWS